MQSQYSLRSPAVKRLMREAQELKEPTETYHAHPLEDNLFEWHFTIRGPEDTEFAGGIYHGRIILPPDYPMKPPSIILLTPNGRFETFKKICLSISGHHPESWQPSWSIRTALLAIIGFMPTHGNGAIGSLDYTPEERKVLARRTMEFKCSDCGPINCILKPVTEASKQSNQEAKELAQQINFQGEKEKKPDSDTKSASEPSSSVSSSNPDTTTTAAMSPNGPFPPLPAMGNPFPMMPPFMNPMFNPQTTAAGAPPAIPPQMFMPPFWPPNMPPPQVNQNNPLFWPPGMMPPVPPHTNPSVVSVNATATTETSASITSSSDSSFTAAATTSSPSTNTRSVTSAVSTSTQAKTTMQAGASTSTSQPSVTSTGVPTIPTTSTPSASPTATGLRQRTASQYVWGMTSAWNPSNPASTNGGGPAPPAGPHMDPSTAHLDSAHPTAQESSPESAMGDGDELGNDAEGVWSPDIEQSFQEALAIYPPCGRRKIILSDEGKMYGRNELIARYIKLRTGKTRTRKQVSSHLQVLARRKTKEIQSHIRDQSARENILQQMASMSSAQIVSASANKSAGFSGLPAAPLPLGSQDHNARDRALQTMASMSSAQIVSATAIHNKMAGGSGSMQPGSLPPPIKNPTSPSAGFWQPGGLTQDVKPPYGAPGYDMKPTSIGGTELLPPWQGRSIAGLKLRLIEFSAFLEQQRDPESYHKHLFVHIGTNPTHSDPMLESVDIRQIYDKFPEKKGGLKELYDKGPTASFFLVKFWADINTNVQDETGAFYGVTSVYESSESMTIQCSTKVCSFGKQVVEKVETEYARMENGRFVYRIHRSPMCEYMINFIHKLKHLPEKYMMNSVLENFTILQVVTNRDTQETLLCTAFVFEVSTSVHGAQHHIYKLVKD